MLDFCCPRRERQYVFVLPKRKEDSELESGLLAKPDALPKLKKNSANKQRKRSIFAWVKPKRESLDIQPHNPQKRGALSFIKPPGANPFRSLFARQSVLKSPKLKRSVNEQTSLLSDHPSDSNEHNSLDTPAQEKMFSQKVNMSNGFLLETQPTDPNELSTQSSDFGLSQHDALLEPSPAAKSRIEEKPITMSMERENSFL